MTNKNSKISFVIPAYNCADTLDKSVESIINGNLEDGDEIIIVNDGSTDDTLSVIEKIQGKFPFIKIMVNKENIGCPATRNVGINAAKNELIFNLDSDNILAKNSVRELKKHLVSEGADVAAFSDYYYFKGNVKKITHKWLCNPGILTLADLLAGHINPGPGGNFLYTKSSWQKIGGYWEYGKGLHEAWGFTLKQIASGSKFVVLPNSFYYHRHGTDSLFVRESKKSNEMNLIATRMIMNFKDMLYPGETDYINNPDNKWFSMLNERPIMTIGGTIGKNGRVKKNFKDMLIHNTKTIIKRIIGIHRQ